MGLVVTLVLMAACYFLFRSMLHQLSKVPPTFDNVPDDARSLTDPSDPAGR